MRKRYVDRFWSDPFGVAGEGLSPEEELVSSTIKEWYAAKHRPRSAGEVAFINSLAPEGCPFCGLPSICGNGRRADGVRRYVCRNCGKSFNPLTRTVFQDGKMPISEWVEFLVHLFEFRSAKSSSRDNRNAETTGHHWLSKAFAVLEGCQSEVMLKGTVWLDETYVRVDKRKRVTKGGKGLRGISRNQVCIGVATDGESHLIVVEGTGKPGKARTLKAFAGHIEPGSELVHDGDNSHSLLVEKLGLSSKVCPTSETSGLDDCENPMGMVNDVHSKLADFLRSHKGIDDENLHDWLNLFWLIYSPPHNRYEKVAKFIRMAVSRRIVIKFRDVFGKNDDEA